MDVLNAILNFQDFMDLLHLIAGGGSFPSFVDDTPTWTDPGGKNLGDRLWDARTDTEDRIRQQVRNAAATGMNPKQLGRELEEFLSADFKPKRDAIGRLRPNQLPGVLSRSTNKQNRGRGSYPARRLARHELSRAHGDMVTLAARSNPAAPCVKWTISPKHPKPDDCDRAASGSSPGLPRGVYYPEHLPSYPSHIGCLCTIRQTTLNGKSVGAKPRLRVQSQAGEKPRIGIRADTGPAPGVPSVEPVTAPLQTVRSGVPEWKPTMHPSDIAEWNVDSALRGRTFYHVGTDSKIASVRAEGFKGGKINATIAELPDSTFFSTVPGDKFTGALGDEAEVQVAIRARKALEIEKPGDIYDAVEALGIDFELDNYIPELKRLGYDAVVINNPGKGKSPWVMTFGDDQTRRIAIVDSTVPRQSRSIQTVRSDVSPVAPKNLVLPSQAEVAQNLDSMTIQNLNRLRQNTGTALKRGMIDRTEYAQRLEIIDARRLQMRSELPKTKVIGDRPKPDVRAKPLQTVRSEPGINTVTGHPRPFGDVPGNFPDIPTAQRYFKDRGIVHTPQSPRPITLDDYNAIAERVEQIPAHMLDYTRRQGKEIHVITNRGITVHPDHERLRGVTPRGWEGSGKTWDDIPGGGGSHTYVVANRLYEGHGSADMLLHEWGHTLDNTVYLRMNRGKSGYGISQSEEWQELFQRKRWNGSYESNYAEEAFAESVAKFLHGPVYRDGMDVDVHDFLDDLLGTGYRKKRLWTPADGTSYDLNTVSKRWTQPLVVPKGAEIPKTALPLGKSPKDVPDKIKGKKPIQLPSEAELRKILAELEPKQMLGVRLNVFTAYKQGLIDEAEKIRRLEIIDTARAKIPAVQAQKEVKQKAVKSVEATVKKSKTVVDQPTGYDPNNPWKNHKGLSRYELDPRWRLSPEQREYRTLVKPKSRMQYSGAAQKADFAMNETMDAISAVHKIPKMTSGDQVTHVPWKKNVKVEGGALTEDTTIGTFHKVNSDYGGLPTIMQNKQAYPSLVDRGITNAHEYGHYLDAIPLNRTHSIDSVSGTKFMSQSAWVDKANLPPGWSKWADATRKSKQYAELKKLADSGNKWGEYTIAPQELFANHYAQWIAIRSENQLMMEGLIKRRGWSTPNMHSAEDFKPIADALDTIFGEAGWKLPGKP